MSFFREAISEFVWDIKYRYRKDHVIQDHTIEDTWQRVASAIAQGEKNNVKAWQQQFYELLENFKFLPGGRILAGAGTALDVTLFNCFVMPIADSLPDIFNGLKESALTLQEGGGIGYDFSPLRPAGFLVKHTGALASGPISFMRIWNAMCATMLSTGARRGAMMGILRCDHPDIEKFVVAKADPHELRHFNISVLITHDFMQAVAKDDDWELVFPIPEKNNEPTIMRRWSGNNEKRLCQVVKKIKARELWQKIISAAYEYAEPGVIFEDTINDQNNLWYCEWINATNPCGEIPLPNYGACNLGAINLTQFVSNAFLPNAKINWTQLEKVTMLATRFLDNVINVSRFPLAAQKQQALATRRIGLGVTGLADVMVMLGIKYGSPESLALAQKITQLICNTTWSSSIELAQEKGSFPLYDQEKFLQGNFVKQLPETLLQDMKRYGLRNSHHNTIAPTGTISLLANNISNGIEPIFSVEYERTVREADGHLQKFKVMDYALREWREHNSENFPPAWIDTHSLTPQDHLKMQAVMQPFIDNAISKTINIPENFPFENLAAVYTEAFNFSLKGCTIFRPNPITGSVLTATVSTDDSDRCCQQ